MGKFKSLFSLIAMSVLVSGCHSIKTIGEVNGVTITKITTRDCFAPSTTTIVESTPLHPDEIEVLNKAAGPGFVPAVATAGGIAGGAALLRPARSTTTVSSADNSTVSATGGHTPPGHINNPGHSK